MAQIINITSEALQATIRRLLPSQQGFGEDLQAQNVVVPIIDLTPTAEGSSLPLELTNAAAFASNTFVNTENSTATGPNSAGFWRCQGTCTVFSETTGQVTSEVKLNDGSTHKNLFSLSIQGSGTPAFATESFDLIVFLRSGDSVDISSSASRNVVRMSYRQIADVNGNLINPSGFTPQ